MEKDLDTIIEGCQKGDEAAFLALFRSIRNDIHHILIRTVGPDQELEDMIQTASLEVFRSVGSFKGGSKFSTWLYRLVVNVALQHLRRRKRLMPPVDIGEMSNELVSPRANPEEHSQQRETVRLVREILDDMAPKKRIVFILHEVEGRNPEEIAEIVGSSRFTVKSRLFYARKDFFKKLRRKATILGSLEITGAGKGRKQ